MDIVKMHGLGNDFVLLDGLHHSLPELDQMSLCLLADRHRGVGCDQILILSPVRKNSQGDVALKIYNADGSFAEACGNGIRCAAHFLALQGMGLPILFQTDHGVFQVEKTAHGLYRADMGKARFAWEDIPLSSPYDVNSLPLDYQGIAGIAVNIGNPHAVFFVENCEAVELKKTGPSLSTNPIFKEGANIEFVSIINDDNIRMRVWERGVGITQACGSGACAAAVSAIRHRSCKSPLTVKLDGGDLTIEWAGDEEDSIFMTGPATLSFNANLPQSFFKATA